MSVLELVSWNGWSIVQARRILWRVYHIGSYYFIGLAFRSIILLFSLWAGEYSMSLFGSSLPR